MNNRYTRRACIRAPVAAHCRHCQRVRPGRRTSRVQLVAEPLTRTARPPRIHRAHIGRISCRRPAKCADATLPLMLPNSLRQAARALPPNRERPCRDALFLVIQETIKHANCLLEMTVCSLAVFIVLGTAKCHVSEHHLQKEGRLAPLAMAKRFAFDHSSMSPVPLPASNVRQTRSILQFPKARSPRG